MKIAVAATRYPPAPGGAEKYIERLAEGFAGNGREVKVFTSDYEQHHRFVKLPTSSPRRETVGGVEIFRERSIPWKRYGYFFTPSIPGRIFSYNPDVVYGFGFGYWPALAGKIAALTRRTKFVLQTNFQPPGSPFAKTYAKLLGPLLNRADGLVFYSKFERELYLERFPEPKRYVTAPPGVDEIFLKESTEDALGELGLSGKKAVLSVGRVDAGKCLDVVVRAAPAILDAEPDAVFVFAGRDFGETERLVALSEKLGVRDKINFTGSVAVEKLAALYRQSSVFAHPSGFELFGIAVAEAFASGTPVVATSAGSIPELVEHETTGLLVPPDDVEAFASSIVRLLRDKALREKIIPAAREKAAKNYDWRKTVAIVDNLIEEVAG